MEIYKLKDFGEGVADKVADAEILRITDLRQGVKNPERVNVFVNEKYEFSLDVAQIVDLQIKKGMVITAEQLLEYKKASEFGKLYQRTLEWVLVRPRSEREVRDYLWRKLHGASSGTASRRPVFTGDARLRSRQRPPKDPSEAPSELSLKVVERLVSKNYVDDRKFAEFWVENRFVKKGISKKRLKLELIKKGISSDIVEDVLGARNDEEEILKIIAKKRAKYDDEKLISYLCRQGFSYELAKKKVQSCEKD